MNDLSQEDLRMLVNEFGPTLVAAAAECNHFNTPTIWAESSWSSFRPVRPNAEQSERLTTLRDCMSIIRKQGCMNDARNWLIGRGCNDAPVFVIRNGDFEQALASAQRFADDTWD